MHPANPFCHFVWNGAWQLRVGASVEWALTGWVVDRHPSLWLRASSEVGQAWWNYTSLKEYLRSTLENVMRWDLITQQKSSVATLNQYRAGPGTRSRLMYLYAPREIVAAAFKWRQGKHGISMTHSSLRWLGWFHEGSELRNGYLLILIRGFPSTEMFTQTGAAKISRRKYYFSTAWCP